MFIRDFEAVDRLFAKMNQLPQKLLDDAYYSIRILMLKLDWYATTADTKQGLQLLDTAKEVAQLDSKYKYFIQFNMARLLFINGDHAAAIDGLDHIVETSDNNFYALRKSSEIIRICAFYEQGEYLLVESLARSLYRRLHKQQTPDKITLLFIKGIQNLTTQLPQNQPAQLIKLQRALAQCPPEEDHLSSYFDYQSWINAKLQNRPLATVIREKIEAESAQF